MSLVASVIEHPRPLENCLNKQKRSKTTSTSSRSEEEPQHIVEGKNHVKSIYTHKDNKNKGTCHQGQELHEARQGNVEVSPVEDESAMDCKDGE